MRSEQETEEVKSLILEAGKGYFGENILVEPFFHEGHWWVKASSTETGASVFDVIDQEPGLNGTGLNFEIVF